MDYIMCTGRARKGPLDGVKISAGPRWDGKIAKPKSDEYHPGHYQWTGHDWLWITNRVVLKSRTARFHEKRK
jgi:hypothetical protein